MELTNRSMILAIMKILMEETDEDHPLNAGQIADRLEAQYETSHPNRKTIYGAIEVLQDFGLEVSRAENKKDGYYIENRLFEMAELKLMVDAVQSSKFITRKKSEELIGKLATLTSSSLARELKRQVYIYDRPKTENETIYRNVDLIHSAINQGKQIGFQYCEWTLEKKLVPKKQGIQYAVSPWSLNWDDENYYLVAYEAASDKIKHYRVDKMQAITVLEEKRQGQERFDPDMAEFSKKTFGMYGGESVWVKLKCRNHLIGVIMDRFGTDTFISPRQDGTFHTLVEVALSPQFYGWVCGIGPGMEILQPQEVAEDYRRYLEGILEAYKAKEKPESDIRES